MTALVCFHNEFSVDAFLRGEYDENPGGADAHNLLTVDDEDAVFSLWVHGGLERLPVTEATADRIYHVDEANGEMWTLNPATGAALSSATWEFETTGA